MAEMKKRQLELAAELGITGAESMQFTELRARISNSPATDAQRAFVTALLNFKGFPLPEADLTYERAAKILDIVAPLV